MKKTAFLINLKGRAPSAQSLWAKADHNLAEKARDSGNISKRQKVVAELFANLPANEQEVWKLKAKDAKDARSNHNTDQCFDNQIGFGDLLATMLQALSGFGADQIGHAIFSVRYAFRGRDGAVETNEFCTGDTVGGVYFVDYKGGTPAAEEDRWAAYA
ncbi:hypothetical protein FKP32DRAFT_1677864 [Trametes sanguinea]|nr:hypothetical protein FKP32DRAFT_1677864 [Trametes sanguinea]